MIGLFPWREVFGVAIGGALGSLARYGTGILVSQIVSIPFPVAILLVNVSGCFFIGMLGQWCSPPSNVPDWLRITLGTGVIGGLTTFSTFGYDTYRLLHDGAWLLGALNVVANLALGLLAIGLGMWAMKGLGG